MNMLSFYYQIGLFSKCMEINSIFLFVPDSSPGLPFTIALSILLMISSWSVLSLVLLCVGTAVHCTVSSRCTLSDSTEIFSQDSGQFRPSCEVQHYSLTLRHELSQYCRPYSKKSIFYIWTILDKIQHLDLK